MPSESEPIAQMAEALQALRRELARLSDRVASLEALVTPVQAVSLPPQSVEGLSEELILVISAAIAAYLGKKAPIRQIRLVGSAAWAQQGRATIHASHERVLSRIER